MELDGYVEVKDRLPEFFAKYPSGCLRQVSVTVYELAGHTFIAYTAEACRTPDDRMPGHGTAWEPVPGLTGFTKNSELQNAETSAWGRAIIAVGAADARKGVATAEDVARRQAEASARAPSLPEMRAHLLALIAERTEDEKAALAEWMKATDLPAVKRMTKAQAEVTLAHLGGP